MAHPERIAGLIFQKMTTSVEGWNPERLKVYEQLSGPETPENPAEAYQFTTVERDMFLHNRGARQTDALNPDAWAIDVSTGGFRRSYLGSGSNSTAPPWWI